jgi:hypothetical protein
MLQELLYQRHAWQAAGRAGWAKKAVAIAAQASRAAALSKLGEWLALGSLTLNSLSEPGSGCDLAHTFGEKARGD